MSDESIAERLAGLEREGLELTHRLAQAIRAGSPETEKILGDIARLEVLIGQVGTLRRSRARDEGQGSWTLMGGAFMKRGKGVAFDEKGARAELLRIAADLRAVERRARPLNAALGRTAEFRRARAMAPSDAEEASRVLPWFWSGGLGDVIMSLKNADRQGPFHARMKSSR
jgi:hypothetical protein